MSEKKKKKNRLVKLYRKYHKWPGMIMGIIVLFFSVSGIIMNHRNFFSEVEINRKYLPENYTFKNWNLASIKGSCHLQDSSILLYGNIGVWKSIDNLKTFKALNQGFPKGIDNRKIFDMHQSSDRSIYAATFSGLYLFENNKWEKINTPDKDQRVVSLEEVNGSLYVMTRSNLYQLEPKSNNLTRVNLQTSDHDAHKVSLFKTLWFIHSGEIFGLPGKLFVDILGIILIVISITGIIRFFIPRIRKRKKKKNQDVSRMNQKSKTILSWHNKLGYYPIVFLIVLTFTGMFLRPPLLIAIANSKVNKIPFTHLADENPWFDKLRMIEYDDELDRFLISTSEGIYFSDDTFQSSLSRFAVQPPISVMGINVFEKISTNLYMAGSFSGLFLWNPETGFIEDFIEGKPYVNQGGRPVGDHIISGFITDNQDNAFLLDYNNGMTSLSKDINLPIFSQEMLESSPMSLWNFSLELHTGRIFENVIGSFYILIVPLSGLTLLLVLISGLLLYLKAFKRK